MSTRTFVRALTIVAAFSLGACGLGRHVGDRSAVDAHGEGHAHATAPRPVEPILTPGPSARVDREIIADLVLEHRRGGDRSFALHVADVIYAEAKEHGLDPLFVAAVTAKESSFRTFAVSHRGAMGLMQVRPFVGKDVAHRLELDWDGPGALHHPEVNVRLGVRYLVELLDRFDGDTRLALAAYHRGPTRVAEQLAAGRTIRSRYADRILDLQASLARRHADSRRDVDGVRLRNPWLASAGPNDGRNDG